MPQERINLPIEIEFFLRSILGVRYHGFSGDISFSSWKNEVINLFKKLKKAIRVNIKQTDGYHRAELTNICDRGLEAISNSRNKDELHLNAIVFMTKLAFLLIGSAPDNWEKRNTNFDRDWKLNSSRSILYIQDKEQKMNLIISLLDGKLQEEKETINQKLQELGYNPEKFLEWFKEYYKDIYLELFG